MFGGEHYDLNDFKPNKSFIFTLENLRKHKKKAALALRNFVVKAEKLGNRVTLREFCDFLR